MREDLYLNDLAEETGLVFEKYDSDHYDMNDFVPFYMNSNFRKACDKRNAREATSLAWEQKRKISEELNKKNIRLKKHNGLQYDPILCAWIGEFYTYLQAYTGLSSKKIIEKYPFNHMYAHSKGLHDLNPPYAAVRWAENAGIKERTGIKILPDKIKI